MDANLTKSLTDLIDETLQELEELRKSRFSATEIKIEGPGDGIAGKPSDGDLHAKKEDKDEDDKEEKEEMDEAKKGENEEAAKAEDMDKKEDKDEDDKEEKDEDKDKHPKKKETAEAAKDILDMHKGEMKKSLEETESLMKSYVEERVKPLEDKLATILDLVNKIAEQPVSPKGVTSATPLFKSDDASGHQPLSKAEVAGKLFELKKSGTRVDSLDITKAEMGQDLASIIKKYEIS